MYKIADSKDIQINVTNNRPQQKIDLKVEVSKLPSNLTEKQVLKGKIFLQNWSNIYLWQVPVKLISKEVKVSPSAVTIPYLAPGQKKEIEFNIKASSTNKLIDGFLTVNVSEKEAISFSFKVFPYYYNLGIKITIGVFGLTIIFLIVKKLAFFLRR